jgi:ATP-dependent Clp protease ATP-binding subunit ClpX
MTIETQDAATAVRTRCSFCAKASSEVAQLAEQEAQLAAWGESMTDEQILDLLPRIAAVAAQTEASLLRACG